MNERSDCSCCGTPQIRRIVNPDKSVDSGRWVSICPVCDEVPERKQE